MPLDGSTTTTAYSYIVNGGSQNNKGIEALIKYTAYQSGTGFLKAINPFANFTYSNFQYQDYLFQTLNGQRTGIITTDYSGKAVAGVAKYMVNAGIDIFTKPGIYASTTYMYKDKMPITSDEIYYTTSYNLLNAKAGIQQKILKHFEIDAFLASITLPAFNIPSWFL